MNTTKITVTADVLADVQKVWVAFTDPKHITKQNFAIDEWHCPSASNDLRIGGKYVARMEAKDGSFGFDYSAVYNEIIPNEKIVYTLDDGRVVETTFKNVDGQTKVTTVFDAEDQNPMEMQQQGWQAILNNFKKYTEQ